MNNIDESQNTTQEPTQQEDPKSRKNVYIVVVLLALGILAIVLFYPPNKTPDNQSNVVPNQQIEQTQEFDDSQQTIEQELGEIQFGDLDAEFREIDQELNQL